MKIYIKNLGNVKKANIEIKNLTVLVGKNNTNKTWTAYLIYALAAETMLTSYFNNLLKKRRDSKIKDNFRKLSSLLKKVSLAITEGNENTSFKQEALKLEEELSFNIEDFLKEFIKDYTKFVKRQFPGFLSVSDEDLKNLSFSIRFSTNELKEIKYRFLESIDENMFNKHFSNLLTIKELKNIFLKIVKTLIGEPFNIPAERKTLTVFSIPITLGEAKTDELKDIIFEQLLKREKINISITKLIRIMTELKKLDYNYPIPIIDFKDFILRIINTKEKDDTLNKELTGLLEESVLEGKILVDSTGKLKYFINDDNSLDVSVSSSMVKGLSGLDLYLKYKASPGDLLIIDEPEMNLHPEAQVKMIEFLAILANKGIKVLITTHSPYIVDHLINLIEAYKSKKENVEDLFWEPKFIKKGKFKKIKPKDIFINKNNVSAYLFNDNGEVIDILDKKTGLINWQTFSSISEKIASLYYEV
ncbi:AAA family ATPase [Persephonella sp.]